MPKYGDVEPFKNSQNMRAFEKALLHHGSRPREIYFAWQIAKICLLRVSDVIKLKKLKYNPIYDSYGYVHDTVIINCNKVKVKKYNSLALLHQLLSNYRTWLAISRIHSR